MARGKLHCGSGRKTSALRAALTEHLIHRHGGSRGGVEGADLPLHGQAEDKVAALLDKAAHALALGTDDERYRTGEVGRPQAVLAVCRSAVDPQSVILELLYRGGDVRHSRDGHVLGSTGGGLVDNGGEPRAAALRNDDAVRADAFRSAAMARMSAISQYSRTAASATTP